MLLLLEVNDGVKVRYYAVVVKIAVVSTVHIL